MYTRALYERLHKFFKDNHIINEAQAGFRQNYSTTDNVFNLTNIIKIKWNEGVKKVFCYFVDFSAAIDGVMRS